MSSSSDFGIGSTSDEPSNTLDWELCKMTFLIYPALGDRLVHFPFVSHYVNLKLVVPAYCTI